MPYFPLIYTINCATYEMKHDVETEQQIRLRKCRECFALLDENDWEEHEGWHARLRHG